MRGASPIVYPALMAYKRLKLVIRGGPEIHPGNLEEHCLFLTVSLGDLPMYPNIAIGFLAPQKPNPIKEIHPKQKTLTPSKKSYLIVPNGINSLRSCPV